MKKAFSFLMLLVAMLLAWPLQAQVQLTVANGTGTNQYVPIYGFYADAYLRAQMIYPASMLAPMTGGTISSMTFYAQSNADWGSVTFQVKVGTVAATTLSDWSTATLTTVYTGIPSINSSNLMVINFTTPYTYTGGNLLVEFVSTTYDEYEQSDWYGITSNGSSVQGYDYDDVSYADADQQDFLPKCTFGYTPGPQSCPMPFALTVSNIDYTSADITWRDTASAGAYRLYWAPTDTLSLMDSVDVYDTTYSLYSLYEGENYTVQVKSLCSGEESYATSTTFSTNSHILYYNMTQSFDSIRTCHAFIYDNGGPTGSYSSYSDNTLVIRPNTDDSTLVISGTSYTESTYDYLRIYDGVGTSGTQVWNDYGVTATQTFGPFVSQSGAFTFVFHSDVSVQYSGFEIEAQCYYNSCPAPSDFHAVAVGPDEVTLSWTAGGNEYQWTIDTNGVGNDFYDTTATFYGLTPNTNYTFTLRGVCGADDTSLAVTCTVRTTCTFLDVLPYTQNFDAAATGGSQSATFVDCMTRLNNGSSYYGYPYVGGSTYNHTSGGSKGLYWYNSTTTGTYGDYQVVVLPGVDTLTYPVNTLQLNFWARPSSTSYRPVFQVGVMSNPDDISTFQPVATVNVQNVTNWQQFEIPLSSFAGQGNFVAIRANRPTSSWYAYVDDITLDVLPACPHVQNVRVDSMSVDWISISWTEVGSATQWLVEYDTVPFTPGNGLSAFSGSAYDTTYSLTGLDTGRTYYIYVAPDCNGEATQYEGITATTLAVLPATVPYSCDFEGTGNNGWDFVNGSQTNHWMVGSATGNPGSSLYVTNNNTANAYSTSSTSFAYAVRNFNLPDTGEYLYSFDWKAYGEGNYDYIRAWMAPATATFNAGQTPDGGTSAYNYTSSNPSGWIPLDGGSKLNLQSSWQSRAGTFRLHQSGAYMMVFMWANDGSGGTTPPGAIDNIEFALNSCPAPYGLTVSNVGTDEVTLHWNAGGSESMWSVFDGTNYYTSYDTTYTIYNLNPDADYHFVVRALCDAGDSSLSISTNAHTNPTCFRPFNFAVDHVWGDTVFLTWTDTTNAPSYEIAYGPVGFDPDTVVNNIVMVYGTTSYPLSGLTIGQAYQFYLRINCTADNSAWVGPVSATPGYVVSMGTSGTQTMHNACGVIVYDNGGASGDYSSNVDATLVIYPDAGNMLCLYGTSNIEYCCDHLYIYDGVGTNGTLLASSSTTAYNTTIDTVTSQSGPLTIQFTSDGSVLYGGYELFTFCVPAPECPSVVGLAVTGNTSTSLTLDWVELGTATQWEAFISPSSTATPTADSTIYNTPGITFNGLTAGTTYYMWVRPVCTTGTAQWAGPVSAIPGQWIMRANHTDTVHMCGGVIYDDGGPNGSYAGSQNSTLIIMPDAPGSLVQVSGSSYTESSWDYITIYDGIGTSGTLLWTDDGLSTLTNFGPFISSSGAITVTMESDGTVQYDGFQINVSCIQTYCRITGLTLDPAIPASGSQLALTWDDNGALYYEVEYGTPGFTPGMGIPQTVYTNSIIIPGLTGLTSYEVHVRSFCGVSDTGEWAVATFQTEMCDNVTIVESWDSTMSASTSSYAPMGYSLYNYGYVQTLVDSAQMAAMQGDITAFAFKPSTANKGDYYNHITVYMANVPETSLSSAITPDANHVFVKVIDDRNMCYSDNNWQLHAFDSTFTWDGHSNVLVAVKRDHGSYSSGASFETHTTSATRTRYYYTDSGPISITSPSGSSGNGSYVGDFRFYSCDAGGCARPAITHVTGSYQSATINWAGNGTAYQVACKAVSAASWPTETAVSGNSYTFTGLQPATAYQLRVRQDCTADAMDYSAWATTTFVTDSVPCLAPANLTVSNITNTSATFGWTARGNEIAWDLHVWSNATGFDSIYTHLTNPANVGGFTAGVTFNAAVRALCGNAQNIEGEWGDTVTFTGATCPTVTGLASSNVTDHNATLTWNAVANAQSYKIIYTVFGSSDSVVATTNSYTFTGLEDDANYRFDVFTLCGTNWRSENSAYIMVTTQPSTGTSYTVTTQVNNPAYGSVTGGGTYSEGSTATLTAIPNEGYHFVTWNDNVTTNPRTITVTGNVTYTAYFAVNTDTSSTTATLTVFVSDPQRGYVTINGQETDTYVGEIGDVVTLSAMVFEGSVFQGWSDGNSNATRSYMLTESSATLTATFVAGDGIDDVTGATCSLIPNPAKDVTTVSVTGISGKVRIAVIDINGREVMAETVECAADCEKRLDLEGLAQGSYFVRITSEQNNPIVKKLIVR